MKAMIFTVMPMFVCLFWSTMLAITLCTNRRPSIDGQKKELDKPHTLLLIFMLTATVLYFGHCVFFNHNTSIIPFTDTLYCTANLSVYPIYYLYICSLTIRREHYKERAIILLPAFGGGIYVGLLYAIMSPEETQQFINSYLYHNQREGLMGLAAAQAYAHDTCRALFAILILPVFFHGRVHIRVYNEIVYNTYSDTEDKTLSSLHYMLSAFIVTTTASFVFNIIGRQLFVESMWLLAIPSTLFSIMLFCIGFIGYRQQFSIADLEREEQQPESRQIEDDTTSELRQRIELLMKQKRLFLRPNLKIVDLVQLLNTNRNYIYIAINRGMGISFSEYVNRMRVEHAATLISRQPTIPLTEIAEQSGFSSSTSFYRNFKHYMGMGPKEYQGKQKRGQNVNLP